MLLSRTVPRPSHPLVLRRIANPPTRFLSHTTTPTPSTRPSSSRKIYLTSALVGLTLSTLPKRRTLLDSSPVSSSSSTSSASYSQKTPLTSNSRLNPAAIKQISLGSLLGLGAGVLVSAFSRTLTLLIGVGIVLAQYAARKGWNVVPVERVQRYVRGVDVRGLVRDNVALKVSFGIVFALTALGEF